MELNVVTPLIAFGAGVVSFLSPCILSLLPVYIAFISGTNTNDLANPTPKIRQRIFLSTLLFVFGFSLIFLLLGFSASALGGSFARNRAVLTKIASGLIIVFGASMLGIFKLNFPKINFLNPKKIKSNNPLSAFFIGFVFGVGWTPCISAILGSILILSATSGSIISGVSYLSLYSLGLAVPFLLVAILLTSAFGVIKKISKFTPIINKVSGVILIIFGILLFNGQLTKINSYLNGKISGVDNQATRKEITIINNQNKKGETTINPAEIKSVLPKDAIPALDNPKYLNVSKSNESDNSLLLGFSSGENARAYPIRIMNWHEIVNDTIDETPVLITYCPLCGSGIAFERNLNGATYDFGVSGKLYKNNLVMYDRQTQSYWSQSTGVALAGVLKGKRLKMLPLVVANFADWKKQNPQGKILTDETGFARNYKADPYGGYAKDNQSIGIDGAQNPDDRLPAKEVIFGVVVNDIPKAYPLKNLPQQGEIRDKIAGAPIKVQTANNGLTVRVFNKTDGKDEVVAGFQSFWFNWAQFYPNTLVYKNSKKGDLE